MLPLNVYQRFRANRASPGHLGPADSSHAAHGPRHGHAIAKSIEYNSAEVLLVEQGSLYPALHRLIRRGWIAAEEGTSENNRRAKFYRLTAKGRRQLTVETGKWEKLSEAIARILNPAEQQGRP